MVSQLPQAVLLYVTAPGRAEALRIGKQLVTERLAACANVLDGMTSVYEWQSEVREENEAVLLLKTRHELAVPATQRIVELHTYECPCVVALPLTDGNPAFLSWILAQTSPV